jgi:hypothetical protein
MDKTLKRHNLYLNIIQFMNGLEIYDFYKAGNTATKNW